jgi:SAM-dependent methyltransferase
MTRACCRKLPTGGPLGPSWKSTRPAASSHFLHRFKGHLLAAYPDVDFHRLPHCDASFDLVVHSDTLEHVDHPIHALAECRRVLKPGGALCFTIPVIVGRMSRDRAEPSWQSGGSVG